MLGNIGLGIDITAQRSFSTIEEQDNRAHIVARLIATTVPTPGSLALKYLVVPFPYLSVLRFGCSNKACAFLKYLGIRSLPITTAGFTAALNAPQYGRYRAVGLGKRQRKMTIERAVMVCR